MARDTKKRIMKSAEILFSERQFDDVSIAEICRMASVSNGVYYRYFRNKEELILSLNNSFLDFFRASLKGITGNTVDEKLMSFISIVLDVGRIRNREITIFREGQYRFFGYEDELRRIYMDSACTVFGRPIDEAEYLFILSGLRFCSTRALYAGMNVDPALLKDLILHGVFPEEQTNSGLPELPDSFSSPLPDEPKNGYEKLVISGLRLFGEKGFYNTGVADIVRECGLAVGTFYSHFESKESFLNTLVMGISERTRHYLSEKAYGNTRLERELTGMWYFLNYFYDHPEYYSIVRETEFVAREVVNRYYDSFERGYLKNLAFIEPEDRRLHAANFLMGLSHYTGIEVIYRKRISDIKTFLKKILMLLNRGMDQRET